MTACSRRNNQRSITLYPKAHRFEQAVVAPGQETYEHRIGQFGAAHTPRCECFCCACIREAMHMAPLDPAPELTEIGRCILERAAERDEVRIRLAPDVQVPVGPTLITSAGVGALLGATLFLMTLS